MRFRARARIVLGLVVLVSACGGQAADPERDLRTSELPTVPADGPFARVGAAADVPRIIVLGDSLTAGLGLDVGESFPARIQERLDQEHYAHQVISAGVSGDTSAGGLRRLEWALSDGEPKVLIVALGGNDGLRGLPPEELERNLAAIIERGRARGLAIILAGMEAPPNFGADYTARFRQVYVSLARRYTVPLIPFLLEGVAGHAELNQPDGIHPNPRGAQVVADHVWRTLQPELIRTTVSTTR